MSSPPPNTRAAIGLKLKALREARRWSQVELAKRLGISQARLSLIENGKGSLDAEEFLAVLRIFNVFASHFDPRGGRQDADALQNALVRLGASHLLTHSKTLPSEALDEPVAVVKEVLTTGLHPRQITALAPVLVRQIDRINPTKLWTQFFDYGLEQRVGWLLENVSAAIHDTSPKVRNREASERLRRAETLFRHFLASVEPRRDALHLKPLDILGQAFSQKTLDRDEEASSEVSRRWSIISRITPHDFTHALEAALDVA
jgi:transcriptional regulator with XRE-family HTH domain